MTTNEQVQAAALYHKFRDTQCTEATRRAFYPASWLDLPAPVRELLIYAASRATPADPALDPATVEAAAKCVPTTWLDHLLSGPKRVGDTPFGAHEVEALLRGIATRIRALASGETK